MNIKQLTDAGYKIENAKITSADLSMEDHGCLTFNMVLDGGGWGCNYGGYCLGHGYLGANEFEGSSKGLEYIMRIMDTVGVSRFSDLEANISGSLQKVGANPSKSSATSSKTNGLTQKSSFGKK